MTARSQNGYVETRDYDARKFLKATKLDSGKEQLALCSTDYAQPTGPVKEAVISGRLIAKIGNGDFVRPMFSPDGTMLAYSSRQR